MATYEQFFSIPVTEQGVLPADGGFTAAVSGGNGGGAPVTVSITDPGVDLVKKTVCIKVRLSSMGNTRKVSTSQIEVDADRDLLRLSKQLVASAELKAIGRFDGEVRRFLSFGVPDQLKGISRDVWEQEREKAAQRMAEASSEIQHVLRESMAKLVQHMLTA